MKSSHPLWLRLEEDFLRLYAVTNNYNLPAICMIADRGSIEIGEIEAAQACLSLCCFVDALRRNHTDFTLAVLSACYY